MLMKMVTIWVDSQMNISDCRISDTGLRKLLSSLRYLQDAKLVHLKYVSKQGWEFALMACSDKLKKVKLLSELRHVVSPFVLRLLQARGCRIRWIHKPMLLWWYHRPRKSSTMFYWDDDWTSMRFRVASLQMQHSIRRDINFGVTMRLEKCTGFYWD